jgi:hypothetical protein
MSLVEEARGLVNGPRNESYGHPAQDFAKTGMIWGGVLYEWALDVAASGEPMPVPAELVALCMIGVKMSREAHRHGDDNIRDGIGYWMTLDMVRRARGE